MCANHTAKLCICKGFSLCSILWYTLLEGPWEPPYQVVAFYSWICWFVHPFYQLDDLPWSFLWHFFVVYFKSLLSFMLFLLSSGAYVQVPLHEFINILIYMLEAFKGTHWNKLDELSASIWCFEQEFCTDFPTGKQETLRLFTILHDLNMAWLPWDLEAWPCHH